jgi:hypothetical protein
MQIKSLFAGAATLLALASAGPAEAQNRIKFDYW